MVSGEEPVKLMSLTEEIEQHIAAVTAHYQPRLVASARLERGATLWRQFEDSVKAYRATGNVIPVIEKVNELAVAGLLLEDPTLTGRTIQYEPELMPDERHIDFVVSAKNADRLYVEVKTVHPRTEDNDRNWNKVAGRQQRHQPGTHYIVGKKWMGAAIYTNSFAARGKFLDYTVEFESRLAQAVKATQGRGVLVFCGNGFAWRLSELERFADFYHTGRHRTDDPFAAMETHELAEKEIKLLRNIDAFGYMKRSHDGVRPEEYAFHTA